MDVGNISFSALSQVADLRFFGNALALLVLLFLAGRPLARRIESGFAATILAVLIGLCVTVLLAAAPWPFAKHQIALVLLGLAFFNLLPVRRPDTPDSQAGRWGFGLAALLAATYLAANASPIPFMHYDYFHAAMRSMELARSGTAFSPWLKQFDASGWFLFDQTTSLALDGLEVVWFGTLTGTLSRLVVLLLSAYLVLTLDRLRISRPVLAVVTVLLCIYLLDNAFAFRPHLYVGLVLAAVVTTLAQPRAKAGWLIAVLVALLILAKRDGVVLAPFVTMLAVWRLAGVRTGRRVNLALFVPFGLAAIALLVAGLSFAQIGGVSVGRQLLVSLAQLDPMQLAQRGVIAQLAVCIALPLLSYVLITAPDKRRSLLVPLLMIILVAILVVASAVLLEGGNRFNEGTLLRKLIYFLVPPTLVFLALAFPRPAVEERRFGKLAFDSVALAALAVFLGYHLQDIVNPRHGWGDIAIDAASFFREVVPSGADASIGFLVPQPDSLARSPFGETETYQFPMMTAYLGRDLRFAPTMEELSDRDIIFLPRPMPAVERMALVQQFDRTYRELAGGYGLALTARGVAALGPAHVLAFANGDPVDRALTTVPWKFLDKHWPEWARIAEVPWPSDVTQVMVAWSQAEADWTKPITFDFPNPDGHRVFSVEFSDHPLGDRRPETITITTADGTVTAPAQTFFSHNRYELPIRTQGPFSLSFTAAQSPIEPPWLAPYFVIFDLQLKQETP